MADAEGIYQAILKSHPIHFDALHLLGVLHAQRGRLQEAFALVVKALQQKPQSAEAHSSLGSVLSLLNRDDEAILSFDRAIHINPKYVEALYNRGAVLTRLGRYAQAVENYAAALQIAPDHANALVNHANALAHLGRYDEAITSYERAIAINPKHVDALNNCGVALAKLHRYSEALASYTRALSMVSDRDDIRVNRGSALAKLGRYAEALASYDKALAIQPDSVGALNGRGIALAKLDRYEEAIANYDKVLATRSDYSDAHYNRGIALTKLHRHQEAIDSYTKAITIKPDHAEALNNRGTSLHALNRHTEAIANYRKAIALDASYADALNNLGTTLCALNRHPEGITNYEKALAIKPNDLAALANYGIALQALNRHDDAVVVFEQILSTAPDQKYALGNSEHSRAHVCDWGNYHWRVSELTDRVRSRKPVCSPFAFLSVSDSPADQLTCAATHVGDKYPTRDSPLWRGERYKHDRIRLAYLSADFHSHATAYLMAGLFEQHDRKGFETMAISMGPIQRSGMRSRLVGAFDRFIDVRRRADRDVARLLREAEVDIAIDLKGFTQNCRPSIFTHRPVPIQVNYLGYPGTMGANFIDYIIADHFLIPEEDQVHYSEKVVYLPDCYQVNDSKRRIDEHTPNRGECGLPERGFVFCCFNRSYKITPMLFDTWMALLRQVENSVLWLMQGGATAESNLRQEAQKRGINPQRLVFAPRTNLAQHLARHRLADLFIDTLPYNAHTTASDALWAGLPVVTCAGRTFAGRVAGSLLHTIGLPELVTDTIEDYEALALRLATQPDLLQAVKDKLARHRLTAPLFDTCRFTRHLESAYRTMWEIFQRGESPRSFSVHSTISLAH